MKALILSLYLENYLILYMMGSGFEININTFSIVKSYQMHDPDYGPSNLFGLKVSLQKILLPVLAIRRATSELRRRIITLYYNFVTLRSERKN